MQLDPSIKSCHTLGGCSLVGDHRGDENIALHSMHTLWVREHNRIAGQLKEINENWDEEKLFQTARKITTAVFQHVVFEEWLPLVVRPLHYGTKKTNKYYRRRRSQQGYRSRVNPGIVNSFAAAAFRLKNSFARIYFNPLRPRNTETHSPLYRNLCPLYLRSLRSKTSQSDI